MNKKLLYLVALGGLLSVGAYAQVTIGSGDKPAEGALLDLKEFDDATAKAGGRNAEKGLGLPRVKLTVKNALADIDGATGTGYEGLMVYNVNNKGGMCPGIHVWDGSSWVSLGGDVVEFKPDITMTDKDGNVYDAKWFTADPCDPVAGGDYWTTSNLYTTKDKDGAVFVGGARLNPGQFSTSNSVIIINSIADFTGNVAYGQDENSIAIVNQSPAMNDFVAKFGLSYTWDQANLACPTNWHLPTDVDWNTLSNSYGGQYAAGAAIRANNDFYLANDYTTSYKWGENDTPTALSGFAALPSGNIFGEDTYYFGYAAYWWSATTDNRTWAIESANSTLLGYQGSLSVSYNSVRCVKD